MCVQLDFFAGGGSCRTSCTARPSVRRLLSSLLILLHTTRYDIDTLEAKPVATFVVYLRCYFDTVLLPPSMAPVWTVSEQQHNVSGRQRPSTPNNPCHKSFDSPNDAWNAENACVRVHLSVCPSVCLLFLRCGHERETSGSVPARMSNVRPGWVVACFAGAQQ